MVENYPLRFINRTSPDDPTVEPAGLATAVEHDPGGVQSIVSRLIEDARLWYQDNLEPDQVLATDYYHARPFGDELEGRSKVVSTDLRDAVLDVMPSLMRIFMGSEHAVEYTPRMVVDDLPQAEAREAMAAQATDYVRYVIEEDNNGFAELQAAFKDALVRRLGILKWWADERVQVTSDEYTGLSEQQYDFLIGDEDVTDLETTALIENEDGSTGYNVRVTRTKKERVPRFAAIPPEEWLVSPNVRGMEDAAIVAHSREVMAGELVEMGVDPDIVYESRGQLNETNTDDLRWARQFNRQDDRTIRRTEGDHSTQPVIFTEAYVRMDGDGEGESELRLFQCVGPSHQIVNGDDRGLGPIVDEVPFGLLCPDMEPHTIVGLGFWDLLKEIQRVKSQMLRGTLNSLTLALDPKTEAVQGQVNMQDLISPELAGIIRVRAPGMINEHTHTFVGAQTLPVLEYYDRIREDATGMSRASRGLDADALQSSTRDAVVRTFERGEERTEMIARTFAETGIKALFRGLLKLIVRHQQRSRIVRLRRQYVEVDPRDWDATMDVHVNVALGNGTRTERITALQQILEKQEALLQAGSPLVSNVEYRHTLGRLTELAGETATEQFFKPWGAEQEAELQQMLAQQQPEPDPAAIVAQAQLFTAQSKAQSDQTKAQIDAAENQAKMQLERAKVDLERLKLELENDFKKDELARKHQIEIAKLNFQVDSAEAAQVEREVERDRERQAETEPAILTPEQAGV